MNSLSKKTIHIEVLTKSRYWALFYQNSKNGKPGCISSHSGFIEPYLHSGIGLETTIDELDCPKSSLKYF